MRRRWRVNSALLLSVMTGDAVNVAITYRAAFFPEVPCSSVWNFEDEDEQDCKGVLVMPPGTARI